MLYLGGGSFTATVDMEKVSSEDMVKKEEAVTEKEENVISQGHLCKCLHK